MNRLIIIAAAGIAAFLAFAHPAAAPSHMTMTARPQQAVVHRAVAPSIVVYVAGAVRRPGLLRLHEGARADDAVRGAGGFAKNADRDAVNLAQLVQDGDEIRVLRLGEALPKARGKHSARSSKRRAHKTRSRHRLGGVDLNAASIGQLAQLPGVGYTLAERIVQYRQLNGRFGSVEELADVSGFTQRRVDALSVYLRTGPPP